MAVRWIVGVDGSQESNLALDWALRQAEGREVDVEVLHVEPTPATSRFVASITKRDHPAPSDLDDALERLESATADITAGRAVGHRLARGSPGRSLVDAAADADLLVVGHHGIGGWRRSLGSVSRYCVTHSTTPVVVIPPTWTAGPISRAVVGFDGSEHAAAALHWATSFLDEDVDLRAVVALEVAPWLQEDIVHARLGEELQEHERRLRDLLEAADPNGFARPEIAVRGARAALSRAAESADLVILGATGSGRFGTALMGSVSTWMLDGSAIPIAVVRTTPSALGG